jgi:uncharacterized membrane protein
MLTLLLLVLLLVLLSGGHWVPVSPLYQNRALLVLFAVVALLLIIKLLYGPYPIRW